MTTREIMLHSDGNGIKKELVIVSKLEVPISMIRKPRIHRGDQVESLKHELENKDRDLKSAKTQASVARSEADLLKQKQVGASTDVGIELVSQP